MSNIVLNGHANDSNKQKQKQNERRKFTNEQIEMLRTELDKIDKHDQEYIREPAPNLNMLNPQRMSKFINFHKFPNNVTITVWYPRTREKKRKIIYHYGPTNSGKTYHALEALKKAKNGVYCGMYCTVYASCTEHKARNTFLSS